MLLDHKINSTTQLVVEVAQKAGEHVASAAADAAAQHASEGAAKQLVTFAWDFAAGNATEKATAAAVASAVAAAQTAAHKAAHAALRAAAPDIPQRVKKALLPKHIHINKVVDNQTADLLYDSANDLSVLMPLAIEGGEGFAH